MAALLWDFFLAHAGAELDAAEKLYELLVPHARTFLDKRCLRYGDNWDQELAKAQCASHITVVLVSNHTDRAYYEREEIATAIEMARSDPTSHRVVPVYLDHVQNTPYGLRVKHSIVNYDADLSYAAKELLGILNNLRIDSTTTKSHELTPPQVSNVNRGMLTTLGRFLLVESKCRVRFTLRHPHDMRILYSDVNTFSTLRTFNINLDKKDIFTFSAKAWSKITTTKTFNIEEVECILAVRSIEGAMHMEHLLLTFSVGGIEIAEWRLLVTPFGPFG